MSRGQTVSALLIAGALLAAPVAAMAQASPLVDGRAWQRATLEERRAYLTGISNAISVGARYDTKNGANDSFSLRVQKGLAGAQMGPGLEAIDAWYKAHPSELEKPVLSVIWRELAKQQPK